MLHCFWFARNKKKKEHFGRGNHPFKEKEKEVQGGWRKVYWVVREEKDRKKMRVSLEAHADSLKCQVKENVLSPVGTGAWWAEVAKQDSVQVPH